jgi:hypothetical protein
MYRFVCRLYKYRPAESIVRAVELQCTTSCWALLYLRCLAITLHHHTETYKYWKLNLQRWNKRSSKAFQRSNRPNDPSCRRAETASKSFVPGSSNGRWISGDLEVLGRWLKDTSLRMEKSRDETCLRYRSIESESGELARHLRCFYSVIEVCEFKLITLVIVLRPSTWNIWFEEACSGPERWAALFDELFKPEQALDVVALQEVTKSSWELLRAHPTVCTGDWVLVDCT